MRKQIYLVMTKKNLDEIVALLKDGQHVEIDGLYFSAKRINQLHL